jgi:type IV secretion system T-DNA border endonuclease VirD2
MVKVGARPTGLAAAVLGELDFLRPKQGRVKAGDFPSAKRGFNFSNRASQLWRFALGSNAAVLKKICKGGTANAKELAAQMEYLFSKSASIFELCPKVGDGLIRRPFEVA